MWFVVKKLLWVGILTNWCGERAIERKIDIWALFFVRWWQYLLAGFRKWIFHRLLYSPNPLFVTHKWPIIEIGVYICKKHLSAINIYNFTNFLYITKSFLYMKSILLIYNWYLILLKIFILYTKKITNK